MRTILIVAALSALAACQQAKAPPAEESTPAAAAATPTAQAMVGTFEVTNADGSRLTSVLKDNGTYEDKDAAGKVVGTGTWGVVDGKSCFDPTGDEPVTCYTESTPGADGSFTATPDKGAPVMVKKVG